MLTIEVPAFGEIQLKYLVSDFSGTLSVDGILVDGVAERLNRLADDLEIHILTADTHGNAKEALANINCKLQLLEPRYQDLHKEKYVINLGAQHVIAMGNGNNDRLMLKTSRVGIAICLAEGLAIESARAADIVAPSITDALDLLLFPKRLIATMRF
jgi:soluble P-type ATPase